MQQPVTFILAFVFVLALIGLAAWLVRRFGGNRLGANSSRGRMPRLAVIDAAAVDGRRRLVLVRRDNVEHLIMIGGPSDIVVEPNIVRAAPGRERDPATQRETSRGPSFDAPTWTPPEPVELPEPEVAPEPVPPARPARPSFSEEPRRPAAAVLPERRPEPTIAAVAPEPPVRPEPAPAPMREPAPLRAARPDSLRSEMPRSEPMMPRPMRADPPIRTMPPTRPLERANISAAPIGVAAKPETPVVTAPAPAAPAVVSTTPSTPAAISAADQNLADMAQRLEAALRRPSAEPARSDAPEPRIGAPSVAPDAPTSPRPRAPEISIASAGRAEAPAITPPAKSGFENLEDEMASLLGRPKSSS